MSIYLFNQYHSGYQAQMSLWPEQPNDVIIKWIKDRSPSLDVADFGCGKNLQLLYRILYFFISDFKRLCFDLIQGMQGLLKV